MQLDSPDPRAEAIRFSPERPGHTANLIHSENGRWLLTWHTDSTIAQLWDLEIKGKPSPLCQLNVGVTRITKLLTGANWIAVQTLDVSGKQEACLWNLPAIHQLSATQKETPQNRERKLKGRLLSISPKSGLALTEDADGRFSLWNPEDETKGSSTPNIDLKGAVLRLDLAKADGANLIVPVGDNDGDCLAP